VKASVSLMRNGTRAQARDMTITVVRVMRAR
jgi:hypothetical protein